MTGKTLDLCAEVLSEDGLATAIATRYVTWETLRNSRVMEWDEVTRYVFATDTTQTRNSQLPWSNKTTIPKLCQIRDNLYANYMASMFPRRKWLIWEGNSQADEDIQKREAILAFMEWVIGRNEFYDEVGKLVGDYIHYGNVIATVEWIDQRNPENKDGRLDGGYVGPMIRRISPLDIVFDPTSPSFSSAPKIVRSLVSIGEIKQMLDSMTTGDEDREYLSELYDYVTSLRERVSGLVSSDASISVKNSIYDISGFSGFTDYLLGDMVEILTFYGDIYDTDSGTLLRNHVIKIIDRHKILSKKVNPAYFGTAPIYHAAWRTRPDNLWGMGPLDNLIGMQYRIDHLENIKADLFDIVTFPPLKIKGYVEDFEWGPMSRIVVGDQGDVEMMAPQVQALQANTEIAVLEATMEEMAGSPKEAMGFRTPGEKTKYEVQRLENAASRIFQAKIKDFERQILESCLNAMLELAKRHLDKITIRAFDSDYKLGVFTELTAADLTGNGRIRPIAARHFAEQAEQLQNLTNFYSSAIGNDPEIKAHISTIKMARLIEELLEIQDYEIVQPYIRLTEQAEAQRFVQANKEQTMMELGQPAGLSPEDYTTNASTNAIPQGGPTSQGLAPSMVPTSGPAGRRG